MKHALPIAATSIQVVSEVARQQILSIDNFNPQLSGSIDKKQLKLISDKFRFIVYLHAS